MADDGDGLWVPAANRYGQSGRWGFVEVGDPASAGTFIAPASAELAGLQR